MLCLVILNSETGLLSLPDTSTNIYSIWDLIERWWYWQTTSTKTGNHARCPIIRLHEHCLTYDKCIVVCSIIPRISSLDERASSTQWGTLGTLSWQDLTLTCRYNHKNHQQGTLCNPQTSVSGIFNCDPWYQGTIGQWCGLFCILLQWCSYIRWWKDFCGWISCKNYTSAAWLLPLRLHERNRIGLVLLEGQIWVLHLVDHWRIIFIDERWSRHTSNSHYA